MWSWTKRDSKKGPGHVIFHYHIFKNAGTTVRSILEQNFGPRFTALESEYPDDVVSNDALLRFLGYRPDIAAVSSHALRPPKPENDSFVFHDIVYLRLFWKNLDNFSMLFKHGLRSAPKRVHDARTWPTRAKGELHSFFAALKRLPFILKGKLAMARCVARTEPEIFELIACGRPGAVLSDQFEMEVTKGGTITSIQR